MKDLTATGFTSTDKMYQMIQNTMNDTLKPHKRKIDLILKVLGQVEYFVYDAIDYNAHISKITRLKHSREKIDAGHRRCVQLACLENNITDIFFDLIREFGEAIRNLMIGNYNGVPRSLRWILESTIFWANMQDESRDSAAAFEYFCGHLPISANIYKYLRSKTMEIKYELLMQRLFLKEEWRKSFNDILPKISAIKGDSKLFKHIANFSFKDQIQSLYHEFSSYEHITRETLSEINHLLRSDFASYMNYRYRKEIFVLLLSYVWHTLDLILCIIILTFAKFYGYPTCKHFINRLSKFKGESNIKYFVNLCYRRDVKIKLPILLGVVLG